MTATILTAASGASFDAASALLLAAAGALAERESAGSMTAFVAGSLDPGVALMVAAGAQTQRAEADQGLLTEIAHDVPPRDRLAVLAAAESLLARIDPAWAWQLITGLVSPAVALDHGIGLVVAAHWELSLGSEWQAGVPLPELLQRQLAADRTGRAAVAGTITDTGDERLAELHRPLPARALPGAQARVLLAAAAAIDPEWALSLAGGMLRSHLPVELSDAFGLVARAAVRAGLSVQVEAMAQRDGFVAEQATWLAAAAAAGAVGLGGVSELARVLADRVDDELEPGRELIGGLPLLEALCAVGATDLLGELAVRWCVPPPLLVTRLFVTDALPRDSGLVEDLHPVLDDLLARPEEQWSHLYHFRFGWWVAAGDTAAARSETLRDVLRVSGAHPLRPLPGDLADLLGWDAEGGIRVRGAEQD